MASGHEHEHGHGHDHGHGQDALLALSATAVVSVIPNLILLFVPVSALAANKGNKGGANWGAVMLSFAAGGMLGDVFLHSIPHLLVEHGHGHGHDHHGHEHEHEHGHGHEEEEHERLLFVGLLVILGYLIFYVAERVASLRLLGGKGHSHHHGHGSALTDDEEEEGGGGGNDDTHATAPPKAKRSTSRSRGGASKSAKPAKAAPSSSSSTSVSGTNGTGFWHAMTHKLNPSGWLNLVADSLHNLTDGVALGTDFSPGSGLTLAKKLAKFFAILFHEVPHELGDFTILVHAGLTKSQAIQAQFVTALAAIAGTAIGFVFSNLNKTVATVLKATTSGGFIYIATGIVASIATGASPSHGHGQGPEAKSWAYAQIALEVLGFALGVGIMVIVAHLEVDE